MVNNPVSEIEEIIIEQLKEDSDWCRREEGLKRAVIRYYAKGDKPIDSRDYRDALRSLREKGRIRYSKEAYFLD